MAFEDNDELGLLLETMQNELEDRQEVSLQVREKLNELKAYGIRRPQDLAQDLAQDLLRFERDHEAAFAAARRARLDQPMAQRACRGPSA